MRETTVNDIRDRAAAWQGDPSVFFGTLLLEHLAEQGVNLLGAIFGRTPALPSGIQRADLPLADGAGVLVQYAEVAA